MRLSVKLIVPAFILAVMNCSVYGAATLGPGTLTNNPGGTVLWQVGTNWDINPDWPSGTDAVATINGCTGAGAAGNTTPACAIQMANGSLTTVTVGTLTINLNTDAVRSGAASTWMQRDTRFIAGTNGRLVFDVSSGNATLNISGTGDSKFSFEAGGASAVNLMDDLVVNVTNTSYAGSVGTGAGFNYGAFEDVSTLFGPGGFTKEGPGKMTFDSNAKTYTGPTVFNAGIVQIFPTGQLTGTSSVTINNGATMSPLTTSTGVAFSYTFGANFSVPLKLNGTGANNVGVIRPDRASGGRQYTITNNTELQSDSLIHVQSLSREDTTNMLTFSGVISGVGRLTQTAPASDSSLGRIILTNTNTYSGGTTLNGGRLEVVGSGATFGAGDVQVNDPEAAIGQVHAISHLIISSGVANAIADNKTLSIAGGTTDDLLPSSYAELGNGVLERVGSLVLGGVNQTRWLTYGSTASSADVKNDTYFSGAGMIQVGQPGDFNGDGSVNAADYVTWRQTDNTDTGYAIFRENFGAGPSPTAPLGESAPVPEPSTFALAGLFGSLILASRRCRFAKSK